MGDVVDMTKGGRRRKARIQKNMSREIKREMSGYAKSHTYEQPQAVEGFRPGAFKDMPKSLEDFLTKLKIKRTPKAIELSERIVLDARVHDLSFTSTQIYLRSIKNPEMLKLYRQIRAAIIVTVGVFLPEF